MHMYLYTHAYVYMYIYSEKYITELVCVIWVSLLANSERSTAKIEDVAAYKASRASRAGLGMLVLEVDVLF